MYRIVHNEQTDSYRVERRGLLGWAFVSDPQTGDYLGFEGIDEARGWVRKQMRRNASSRRWKVVAECNV
jgi:IS4 transposase